LVAIDVHTARRPGGRAHGLADPGAIRPRINVVDWDVFLNARLPTALALPLEQGTSARPAWQLVVRLTQSDDRAEEDKGARLRAGNGPDSRVTAA
jgi:hypothetical protein